MQMVTHGIITGSLFLLVGVLYDQAHTRNIDDFGGSGRTVARLRRPHDRAGHGVFGFAGPGGVRGGIPCVTWAVSGWREHLFWVGVSVIGIVVTAAFFLKLIKDVFLGTFNPRWEGVLSEMKTRELITVVPLVALTILIGVYPTRSYSKDGSRRWNN
jgi:NADH-quinone oxidoreductase subunit M